MSNACASVTSVAVSLSVCALDLDCNGRIEPADVSAMVRRWYDSLVGGSLEGDFDGNGAVEPGDLGAFVAAWLQAVESGC